MRHVDRKGRRVDGSKMHVADIICTSRQTLAQLTHRTHDVLHAGFHVQFVVRDVHLSEEENWRLDKKRKMMNLVNKRVEQRTFENKAQKQL